MADMAKASRRFSFFLAFLLVMFPSVRNFFVALPIIALVSLLMAILSWTFVEAPALSAKKRVAALVRAKVEWLASALGWRRIHRPEPVPSEPLFIRHSPDSRRF